MPNSFRRFKRLLHGYRREIRFVLIFVTVYTIAQSLYFFSRPLNIPTAFQELNARVSVLMVNLLHPQEEAIANGITISSGGFSLQISWGCEGIEGMFLIIAALTAFTMRRRDKYVGMVTGIVFLYVLNIIRIVILYFTVKYHPALFDIMHIYVGQTFIIFFGVLFFMVWAYFSSPEYKKEQSA